MDELKPCPFCGGEAFSREYDEQRPDEPYGLVVYHAPACFLAPHADHSGFEARWNTRSPVTDEMVERAIVGAAISQGNTAENIAQELTSDYENAAVVRCMMHAALTAALGGPHG